MTQKKMEEIFSLEKIDVLNHHAAQIDVRKSVESPIFDAQGNILGTLNLLQNCVKYKTKKIIFASSGGAIYGECGENPPGEDALASPISPYGITKRVGEIYLEYYNRTYGLNYLAFRYSNVYGPKQDSSAEGGVVAIFTQKMLNNEEIDIFSDGEQLRDYVFIEDVVKADLLGLTKGINEVINIGTQNTTSVNELFNLVAKLTNYNKKPIYRPARPCEIKKSLLNIEKAKKILGLQPEISLNEGLKKTVEYFKQSR